MDRISTASKAVDLFGAGKHGFKNGDLALGITPTDFNADWFNGVQEELLNVIEAAGLVPAAATRNQLLLALAALFLKRDGSTAMTGALRGKQGAASAGNANNCGFAFDGDPDSGMFNSADGLLQLVTNGQIFLENNAAGALKVLKQFRVPKGAPNSADASTNSGYAFNDDGDTGLFAEGGSANAGSDLVLRVDNGEVARFKATMKSAATSGWARLSSGIIVQWGSFVQTDTGSAAGFTWTFPITFPNAALNGFLTVGSAIGGGAINCSVEGLGTTAASGFTSGPSGSRTYRIFVIGH